MKMLGFHAGVNEVQDCIDILSDYGFRPCVQIFVTGPQSYKEIKLDKPRLKKIAKNNGLVIHGAYPDNPWGCDHRIRAIKNIRKEMKIAEEIGASGVIVHLGPGINDDNVLREVLAGMVTSVTLWLEINATKPEKAFETPGKIRKLYDRINNINKTFARPANIGICIDTAHLHSCGVPLYTYDNAMTWLGALPDCKYMLHLNDSHSEFGSGQDRHAALCQGNIWGEFGPGKLPVEESGLAAFCIWAEKYSEMTILERKTEYIPADLHLLHSMGVFIA